MALLAQGIPHSLMMMIMMIAILAGRALLATTVADLRTQEGDEPQLPDSHKEPVTMMVILAICCQFWLFWDNFGNF